MSVAPDQKTNHVYRHLHEGISGGVFQAGERLPTEEVLASKFGFSRSTVAKAMRLLAKEGLVERRRRAGSFVRQPAQQKTAMFGAIMCGAASAGNDNIFVPLTNELIHEADHLGFAAVTYDPQWRAQTDQEVIERGERFTRQLIDRGVAGVFLAPTVFSRKDTSNVRVVNEFHRAGIPLVLIDRDVYPYPRRSEFDLIAIDNRRAAHVLTEHLLSAGAKRIEFINTRDYGSAAENRVAGYCDALRQHGIEPRPEWVHRRTLTDPAELAALFADRKADAYIAINDSAAATVMRYLLDQGVRIPEDVRLAGFDDLPQSQHLAVPLTTIRQPCAELGAAAVQTMLQRIAHPNMLARDVLVDFELVVRQSCGAK